ncbi:MAG: chemotaxis protein CheC [Clostridia bacterium]|nr:chemotaxis protein CheC [Clostridia bacterium]
MAIQNFRDLNEVHFDVLREIGNIGAGNAATSLAQMMDTQIDMTTPTVKVLAINDAVNALGGPENVVIGILVKLSGDIEGVMMFILRQEFAKDILVSLLGTDGAGCDHLSDMELSAISELGNIMIAAYASSICALSQLSIKISVPSVAVDMVGAILSTTLIEMSSVSDTTIFIEDDFIGSGSQIRANMMLLPTMESLNKLMQSLGIDL